MSHADSTARMPVVFVPHGGGPWPFVDLGSFVPKRDIEALREFLESVRDVPPSPPRALLVVSAHWEAPVPTVQTAEHPPLLFDYHGFPPASYEIAWPAPGAPWLADRVRSLLAAAGFDSAADPARGFDHGTFIPLKVTYPDAAIPTIQLSLVHGLDPALHMAIGAALAPLRDEGVFIVGSGMTFHDLARFTRPSARPGAERFDAWLRAAATAAPDERRALLAAWSAAPDARASHPREEHLLPLMVVAGAAGADRGTVIYNDSFSMPQSAFRFG